MPQKKPQISFNFTDVYTFLFLLVASGKFLRDAGTLNRHGQRDQHLGKPGGCQGLPPTPTYEGPLADLG